MACLPLPAMPARSHDYYDLPGRTISVQAADGSARQIYIVDVGDGPPLLLVHGLMTNSYSFRYVISLLAKTYRVIVPDLPGAGRSEAASDLDMSPQSIAAILEGLLEALSLENVYVVGNSLGGYYSLWHSVNHPDRVRRLAVLHAPGILEFRMRALHLATSLPGAFGLFRLLTRNPNRFVAKNVHYFDPEIMSREETTEYGGVFRDKARTHTFHHILRDSLAPAHMRSMAQLLEKRRAQSRDLSILLLWARQDVMVPPRFGPIYKSRLPGAQLVWMENTSHFMQVDSPSETVAEIQRFDAAHPMEVEGGVDERTEASRRPS